MSRTKTAISPPAIAVAATGTNPENPERVQMVAHLEARLEQRKDSPGSAYRFDLRHRAFGPLRNRSYLTLRDPAAPGWPEEGETTRDPTTAKRWINDAGGYADWVLDQLGDGLPGSVAEAADEYLASLRSTLGEHHNTTRNRTSAVKNHIKPGLGRLQLSALDRPTVGACLANLQVFRGRDKPKRRGARATIDSVRDTLSAIWLYKRPGVSPPFAGLRLNLPDDRRAHVEAIRAGEIQLGHAPTSLTPEQVVRILTAAMWFDRYAIELLPNIVATATPNSAGMIACYLCCAMRKQELAYWRWCHIDEEKRAVFVPGTKNKSAARWSPLQDALIPWLRWLRTLRESRGHRLDGKSFVAPGTWVLRRGSNGELIPSGENTYDRRVAMSLILAGCKLPQKSTHLLRATHITWGTKLAGLAPELVQDFVGHNAPYGATTTKYVDRRELFLDPENRQYIQIPSPDEIAALVPTFKPSVSLDEARRLYGARRG